ncbi:hypothetical protein KZ483_07590 [Paenibacillus sp. sptzw28]|uniref:hypothetical protein n=1 Tax=Paenibacillus sp. sptzw28 TaxID=715179 RepID=UPI001C6E010D|nr:hypothetical protein [Paenibacillus sp. sptzw28]QYR24409.1 hypothetical protein KZ483_07590 [Paenibacillus sp. sptzw28]
MVGNIAALLLVCIIMAMIELPSLVKRKQRKEAWAFSLLLLAGLALNLAEITGIEVPTPLTWARAIYKP